MSYATYTTLALVCGSYSRLTADKSYLLFTREMGMLTATARSVREERSKQRYALQDFSLLRVTLVKGKSGWRIGSAEALSNLFMTTTARSVRITTSSIVKLLRRYVQGEEPLAMVFDDVVAALESLSTDWSVENCRKLEQLFELRLLHTLGYVVQNGTISALLPPIDLVSATQSYRAEQAEIVSTLAKEAARISHL